jgi:TDG/mug DNA glycosylase family protein
MTSRHPSRHAAAEAPARPSPAQLQAARRKRVPDVIGPRLAILFVGINPGLYSGAVGHHFARPGNRFWPALQRSGLTPRQLAPHEERALLTYGIGITNLVPRTTAAAAELSKSELASGGRRLVAKVHQLKPHVLAFLGIEAYRTAFGAKCVKIGPQPETIGTTRLWVLPNPSGLNAHYQLSDFARLFRRLSTARDSVRG